MISEYEIVLRLCVAALLGGLVGVERERRHSWTAGLRTHMLVSVGAALFMVASAHAFSDTLADSHVSLDPSRIAAQVASGVGFLGAGAILLRKDFIRGLTTAASIWTVAAIGVSVGGGMYVAGTTATLLALVILAGMRPLERRFFNRGSLHRIEFSTSSWRQALNDLNRLAESHDLRIAELKMQRDSKQSTMKIDVTFQGELSNVMSLMESVESSGGNLSIHLTSGRLMGVGVG